MGVKTGKTPDPNRARSFLEMAQKTINRIDRSNKEEELPDIIRDYHSVVQRLLSAVHLLEGVKVEGKDHHKLIIDVFSKNHSELQYHEIQLLHDLRKTRNDIEYRGDFPARDYLERNEKDLQKVIQKLKTVIEHKLRSHP